MDLVQKYLNEGASKTYLKRDVISQMIKSGKWEIEQGDLKGKSGSSITLKSKAGKSRNIIIE